jgi:PPOX class probable F420-dependent enzyme
MDTLDIDWRTFMAERRTAILATISPAHEPRLMPICFVLHEQGSAPMDLILYSPLDEKPKRSRDVRELARVRDIVERPRVTLLFERWDEDWSLLAWLRARGTATLVKPDEGPEAHAWAVRGLRAKYPQYREQHIEALPLIRVIIDGVVSWSASGMAPDRPA